MIISKKDIVLKMTLTALLLALNIILSRTPMLSVYVTPFVRFSLGSSIVIFSSLLLGPISGAIVGGVGDILGILIYNPSGVGINPLISIVALFLGIVPFLIFYLIKKINSKKVMFILSNSLLLAFIITIILITSLSTSLNFGGNNIYTLTPLVKVVIIIVSTLILVSYSVIFLFLNKFFNKRNDLTNDIFYKVSIVVLICEVIFALGLSILAKVILFEVNYLLILFPQILISIINIPLSSFVITYLLLLVNKIIKRRETING